MGGKGHLLFKYGLLCFLFLGFVLLTLGTSSSVNAQEEEEIEEFMLEEVVVTAEKREAELQRIPMEISVVRPDDMQRLNVNQVYDLAKILPDVSVQAQVGSFVLVSIREVQTVQFNAMFETTVATHLDGVQLTRYGGLEGHFYDLERVEVLKGPQGTLYGRGSTAGSMNIITRKPILGEFSGNAEIEFGNYKLTHATAGVNVPLTDKLAMRVAGISIKRDGYNDAGYRDQDSRSGRLSFRWEPNDRSTFTIVGDWEMYENNGYGMGGLTPESYYFDTYGDVTIVENTIRPSPYGGGGPVHAPWQTRWVMGNALDDNFNDYSSYGITAIMEYDIDFATLTVQYGHRSLGEVKEFISVFPGASLVPYPYTINPWGWAAVDPTVPTPYTQVALDPSNMIPGVFTATVNYGDTDSIEARLTSKTTIPAGDPIEWIIGAYRQKDKISTETYPSMWAPDYWNLIDGINEAIFGQASWMPIDKWNLTGGARWNWDYKDAQAIWTFPSETDRDHSLMFESGQLEGNQVAGYEGDPIPTYSWSEPTYKLNLSYIPTDDVMTYLQYSKGYRTGNVDFQGRPNHPEKLGSWELGFKSRWFGSRLQFNAGIYYYNYRNYNTWGSPSECRGQHLIDADGNHYCEDVARPPDTAAGETTDQVYLEPDGNNDQYDEFNLGYTSFAPGGAEQMGLSANIIWLITRNDMVTLNGSWSHNEYGDNYNTRAALLAIYPNAISPWRDTTPDQSGREFGGSPIRANMGYSHTFHIGRDVLSTHGTLFYEGKGIDQYVNYGKANQYVMPGRPDYFTASVSALYSSSLWMPAGMMWNVRFSCNNLLDNDALSSISYSDDYGFAGVDVYPTGSGTISGFYILPRTYSITFGINW
jgi:outer membrane receptor protein involved in Fe transport